MKKASVFLVVMTLAGVCGGSRIASAMDLGDVNNDTVDAVTRRVKERQREVAAKEAQRQIVAQAVAMLKRQQAELLTQQGAISVAEGTDSALEAQHKVQADKLEKNDAERRVAAGTAEMEKRNLAQSIFRYSPALNDLARVRSEGEEINNKISDIDAAKAQNRDTLKEASGARDRLEREIKAGRSQGELAADRAAAQGAYDKVNALAESPDQREQDKREILAQNFEKYFQEQDKEGYKADILLMKFDVLKAKLDNDGTRLDAIKEALGNRLSQTLMGYHINQQIRKAFELTMAKSSENTCKMIKSGTCSKNEVKPGDVESLMKALDPNGVAAKASDATGATKPNTGGVVPSGEGPANDDAAGPATAPIKIDPTI